MVRYRWPEGRQCAVVLSFDVDAESGYVFRFPQEAVTRLDEMEERRFGVRTGLPRILRLLERYGLPATFFVPGYTIEHHTSAVETIVRAGHELGCHGNVHEAVHTLDEAAERRVLEEQLAIYQRTFGRHPAGYRSPSWSLNVRSPALLAEYGFAYDSSLMGDDLPYFLETPHGRLTEVPVQWLLDDAPFYRHVYGATNAIAEPDRVVDLWTQEFRGMYRENSCFVLTSAQMPTKFTFNTPDGVETLQYLQDLIWKDQTTIPPGYSITRPRETGKAAMWVGGAWDTPGFRANPDVKFMIALNPEKKSRTLMLQANNTVLFKESKQRDLAWTVMRHMNKEASDLAWQTGAGYIPVALSNFDRPPFSTDPAWQVATKQVRRSDSKPYPIVTNYQEMMNVIGEELVAAYKNTKIAKEALAEAQRRAQELIDQEVAKHKQ